MAVITKPTDPRWGATAGAPGTPNYQTDGTSGARNIEEPPVAAKDTGFTPYLMKPFRQWVNWLLMTLWFVHRWLREQKERHVSDWDGAGWVSGRTVAAVGGLVVSVSSGEEWIAGELADDPAPANLTIPDVAQDNWVYVDTDRVVKQTTSAATAFADGRIVLARVPGDGGGVLGTIVNMQPHARGPRRGRVTVGPSGTFTDLATAVAYAKDAWTAGAPVEIVITGPLTVPATVGIHAQQVRIRGTTTGRLDWSFDGPLFTINGGTGGFGDSAATHSELIDIRARRTGAGATASAFLRVESNIGGVNDVVVRGCRVTVTAGNRLRRGILALNDAARWKVIDCHFDGTGSTGIDMGIECNNANNTGWLIERCTFRGTDLAGSVAISLASGSGGKHIVRGCQIADWDGAGINVDVPDCIIAENVIDSCPDGAIEVLRPRCQILGNKALNCNSNGGMNDDGAIVLTAAATDCLVADNQVTDWVFGFAIGAKGPRTTIKGNICTTTQASIAGGIQCNPSAGNNDWFIVDGNQIDLLVAAASGSGRGDTYGIKMGPFSITGGVLDLTANTADRAIVRGNQVRNVGSSTDWGIAIDASAESAIADNLLYNVRGWGIRMDGLNSTIHGNVITDYDAGGTGDAIRVDASLNSAGRCTITDNVTVGVGSSDTNSVDFHSSASECYVAGNVFENTYSDFVASIRGHAYPPLHETTTTTDAETKSIGVVRLPTNSVVIVDYQITARDNAGAGAADGAAYYYSQAYYQGASGATPAQIGTDMHTFEREGANMGAAGIVMAQGANGIVQANVTGIAGKTITWQVLVRTRTMKGHVLA